MERIWPVLTSITTAVPLTALDDSIALANACSDSYWSWVSRVSSRPVPGTVGVWLVTGDCGRATPEGDSMMVSFPAVPASTWLLPYSRPAAPCPAALVKPTTGAARFPLGTSRLESATNVIPGMASAAIVWPTDCGSCRARTT